MLKNEDVGQEIVERKRLKSYPKPENILAAVADSFSVPKVSLIEKKARNNTARKAAVFLMKRYSGLGNREIGELFNGIHSSAVSKAVTRLKAEMSEDGKPAMTVEKIMSNVKT